MRTTILAGLVAFVSTAVLAQGIQVEPGGPTVAFVDCPFIGTDGGTLHNGLLTEGRYLFRTTGDDIAVCVTAPDAGSTCATGGEKYAQGTMFRWSVPRGGNRVACRSLASDAGDAFWSKGE